jgi:predicted alpha-1,2-mannosidase
LSLACAVGAACTRGEGTGPVEAQTGPDLRIDAPVQAEADAATSKPGVVCPDTASLDLVKWVDPFIGTAGGGNVIPGPGRPHGMVKLSPDSVVAVGDIDAYAWESDRIEGFSHTHFEGPGGSGYGYSEILLLPTVGPLRTATAEYASTFKHDTEEAEPGYYSVVLEDYGVKAELTATRRAGLHRYSFPKADEAYVLIDVGHTRGRSDGGWIEVAGDSEIRGHGIYNVHPIIEFLLQGTGQQVGKRTVYFHARFSRPFSKALLWKDSQLQTEGTSRVEGSLSGAAARFAFPEPETVEVRVGISFIDEEQALKNLDSETEGRSFDTVRQEAAAEWNLLLNRVQATGGTGDDLTRFYTALYHSLIAPADYTEDGRFWSGADGKGKVFESSGIRYHADDWCMWDTFRTSHPLQTLVEPERTADKVASYLHMFEQEGWLPKCPWQATGDSRVMIGNHVICFIADSVVKGLADFDVETAWEAVLKMAMEDDLTGIPEGFLGYGNLGTLPSYVKKGYVPQEEDPMQSVSLTLEFAYNDWCVARLAEALGKPEQRDFFDARSMNYKKHWDEETGFMRPIMKNGTFIEPFDPTKEVGFCEANAWIYSWFAPHDVPGLIELMGGPEPFVSKLDSYFDEGHHDPSNQPGFHTPYLYVFAGAPAKTQERLNSQLASLFRTTPDGLPGNDDSGAMSAWFVLGAMGLYPVAPGSPVYVLGTPAFDSVTLCAEGEKGNRFTIRAEGRSQENIYVQSASLDGQKLERAWVTHDELGRGAELTFVMGPNPSAWGTAPR